MKNRNMNRERRLADIARMNRGFHPADRWTWARAIALATIGVILGGVGYAAFAADMDAGESHAAVLEMRK